MIGDRQLENGTTMTGSYAGKMHVQAPQALMHNRISPVIFSSSRKTQERREGRSSPPGAAVYG